MKIEHKFIEKFKIPMMIAKSIDGPTLWITACAHGDEIGGIAVIHEIFKKIQETNNRLIKGSLYVFPIMNTTGLEDGTRTIPRSKEDLNRCYPGNKSGSLGERIADKIFTTIKETKPDLVLDLHNDWIKSIPYILVDKHEDKTFNKAIEYCKYMNILTVKDNEKVNKSLSYNLLKEGIPALTLELGESYAINEKNIIYGVDAILSIMTHLGMINGSSNKNKDEKKYFYTDVLSDSESGTIRFKVRPGDKIEKGNEIAKIYNEFGELKETIKSSGDGIVLGICDYSTAYTGKKIMAYASNF